jgi:hypothetical protein
MYHSHTQICFSLEAVTSSPFGKTAKAMILLDESSIWKRRSPEFENQCQKKSLHVQCFDKKNSNADDTQFTHF